MKNRSKLKITEIFTEKVTRVNMEQDNDKFITLKGENPIDLCLFKNYELKDNQIQFGGYNSESNELIQCCKKDDQQFENIPLEDGKYLNGIIGTRSKAVFRDDIDLENLPSFETCEEEDYSNLYQVVDKCEFQTSISQQFKIPFCTYSQDGAIYQTLKKCAFDEDCIDYKEVKLDKVDSHLEPKNKIETTDMQQINIYNNIGHQNEAESKKNSKNVTNFSKIKTTDQTTIKNNNMQQIVDELIRNDKTLNHTEEDCCEPQYEVEYQNNEDAQQQNLKRQGEEDEVFGLQVSNQSDLEVRGTHEGIGDLETKYVIVQKHDQLNKPKEQGSAKIQ